MSSADFSDIDSELRNRFRDSGIDVVDVAMRRYPGETIYVISVARDQLADAVRIGNELDGLLRERGIAGFVTVRGVDTAGVLPTKGALKQGVNDPRAGELVRLITARSRASETQPSLAYVPDAAATISTITSPRHQLVFGRRGAGKTALLVEAKRVLDGAGHLTVWTNLQTYRQIEPPLVVLWVMRRWVDAMQGSLVGQSRTPAVAADIAMVSERVESLLANDAAAASDVASLVPRVQHMARRYQDSTGRGTYLFLDDFHYLPRPSQPWVLDALHGCMRDCDVWLKVATIKHLSKWFQASPPLGLQTGHDTGLVDLDVSLQDPSRAKQFLQQVLHGYAAHAYITSLGGLFSPEGLDRLVLASGAVPRDYLVLAGDAIRRARLRPKGQLVGAQDVNRAAGDAAQSKVTELEEDLAASAGEAGRTLQCLARLRSFCLEASRSSYFRVDFADKEESIEAYATLTTLMDLRLVHLVNQSVSDERRPGARSEVFMLDLSQFSGERFKKNIRVLDFRGKYLVSMETGRTDSLRTGDSPNALLAILRRGPLLLEGLGDAGRLGVQGIR